MKKTSRAALLSIALSAPLAAACGTARGDAPPPKDARAEKGAPPTAEEAERFVGRVNEELKALYTEASRAAWVKSTYITDDTDALAAAADEKLMAYQAAVIPEAARFSAAAGKSADTGRMLHLLKVSPTLPAPSDAVRRGELAQIASKLTSLYGRGEWCPEGKAPGHEACQDLGELEDVIGDVERTPEERKAAWVRWRSVSPAMRPLYERLVALGNEGSQEIGFDDVGQLWRSRYDMTPVELTATTDKLWAQVKPLYEQLHCYVRGKLAERFPGEVKDEGTLPAHLLGNMWSQDWSRVYPLVEPHPGKESVDVTKALRDKGVKPIEMVEMAEGFFTSLGLDPLPESFYERSLLVKPQDRDVVCHASAWDVTLNNDVRIKMCIKVDEDNLVTIHHELGHIYYYMNYYRLPVLYQEGAHDGFHEAIGDAIALSITPSYLKDRGILSAVPEDEEGVVNEQMRMALQKVAFLPFGKLIDQWRWDVFSGKTPPERYNAAWWELRQKVQGVHAPVPRSEADFDPGAKFHIPANVPYMRYFLAHVLQFQFHKALCDAAGHEGPLHTCSVYGSEEAGHKLEAMLALGASKPWPDALEAMTGSREMDATAILEYFAPLKGWLEERTAGKTCGF